MREALQLVNKFHATARNLSTWLHGNLANTVTGEQQQRYRTQTEHIDGDGSLSLREAVPLGTKKTATAHNLSLSKKMIRSVCERQCRWARKRPLPHTI